MEKVFAEVKKRTGGAAHYDLRHISRIFKCVGVKITDKQMEFLSGAVDQLALLIEQSDGLFVVTNSHHCVAVDCGRKLIFDCSKPYALHPGSLSVLISLFFTDLTFFVTDLDL